MKNYFYQIASESEKGKQMRMFKDLCTECIKKAEDFMTEHKADAYIESTYGFAGGAMALVWDKPESVPEGWERVEATDDLYLPVLPDDFQLDWIDLKEDKAGMEKEVEVAQMVYDKEQKRYVEQKEKRTVTITESMLVMKRMAQLPIMSVDALLDILKPKKRLRSLSKTPVFFEYRGVWYVMTTFECEIDECEESTFYRKRMAFLNTQDD